MLFKNGYKICSNQIQPLSSPSIFPIFYNNRITIPHSSWISFLKFFFLTDTQRCTKVQMCHVIFKTSMHCTIRLNIFISSTIYDFFMVKILIIPVDFFICWVFIWGVWGCVCVCTYNFNLYIVIYIF